ncbi:MAG: PfkB family carbohydrate kinase, partial [Ghiorsea sp.]|nr:PfkB family carbohydrate kinase [Ghiorsea sp.]
MTINVYGVGNAIMDLQVQCDDAFLEAQAIEKGIMTLTSEEDQQKILDALQEHKINTCSGGSAANTIVGIADMGGQVAYCGKTGSDNFGLQYATELQDLGIHFGA